MKVSEEWLREWVKPSLNAQELAELLTMAGLEVDSISPVAGSFTQVIIAEVVDTTPHPQADKLTLCKVNTGKEELPIVCGASNVRKGLKVALAQIGANLPGGLHIKETRLRGELSQGMLCSASELGLSESSDGIIELDSDAPLGQDLRTYLSLDDQVFDIDLTPNRADCLSVLGIAREVSALTQSPLAPAAMHTSKPVIDEQKLIELKQPEACPHYCGRVIQGINSQAVTPLWMRERLRRAGIRSIHPVVDITNYVMIELGQPMHAFDLQTLSGDIEVRFAKNNEALQLLDGQKVTLADNILVIADKANALAIAGVMGGERSAVNYETTAVFLESAYFNPAHIAGVARRFGLFTDSSQRFERGVDPTLQLQAIERASSLILEICGGQAAPISEVTEKVHIPTLPSIHFNPEKVKQLTGVEIEEAEIFTLLKGLGMHISKEHSFWKVTPPAYRFDIQLDVDLIEEVIRLRGYDRIPGQKMITTVQPGSMAPTESISKRAAHYFADRGYHETISYSFVDPELQHALYPQSSALSLLNPISSELSQMRTGMWPGLLASMIYNIHRQQTSIKFFEAGVTFQIEGSTVQENPCLAGLIAGEIGGMNWCEPGRSFDFYDIKGDLQGLFALLQISNAEFIPAEHSALHPGKSAQIMINGKAAGWCGSLHPRIADALDIQEEVLLFELRINELMANEAVRYKQISKFPQIRRDLSILIDDPIQMSDIEKAVKSVIPNNWLKSFHVFDIYRGENIPQGKKSAAIALILQDDNKTLIDNEINQVIDAILRTLEDDFSITLRD
ncbi:phenylalanyl-tRNA synthetase, beta subunit [Legionella birminghamensis]|uniref:Phenylalanine--tRNA ligase beta subunit n=1 Tax=Legionella birminghamensis TaxID=28083 RepID=A0A378I6G8_9GAMM|nr:phenylalanine--tRNA ligase subunit beta [Legionella birminghamensis]KTC73754.1 phenylalanyl-tRNA synthetase, beta subunit [Legionella birminghamensis]STX30749.1 phenylalanyl-tRNA synthetase, beta subunit [Legionella birminghamensis]